MADRRTSVVGPSDIPNRTSSIVEAPKANRMALPPIRTLRSKFAVGRAKDKRGLLAVAKADLAARHAAKESLNSKDEGLHSASLGNMGERGMAGPVRRLGEEKRELLSRRRDYSQLGESSS